jgi:hypothetical protein
MTTSQVADSSSLGAPSRLRFWSAIGLVFSTAVRNWRMCLEISAPYAILLGVTNAVTRSSTGIVDPTRLETSEVAAAGIEAIIAVGVFLLVNVFVAPVTIGALSLVGSAAVYGDRIDTTGVFRRAIDRALDAVTAFLLTALIIAVPLVALAIVASLFVLAAGGAVGFGVLLFGSIILLPVAVYVSVRLSLAVPVVMREGRGPVEALRRSWDLVKGSWWWVFGVGIVVALTVSVLNGFITFRSLFGRDTAGDFIVGAIVTAIAGVIAVTTTGIASGVIYATRAPEDTLPPEVAASEARLAADIEADPALGAEQPAPAAPPAAPTPQPEPPGVERPAEE